MSGSSGCHYINNIKIYFSFLFLWVLQKASRLSPDSSRQRPCRDFRPYHWVFHSPAQHSLSGSPAPGCSCISALLAAVFVQTVATVFLTVIVLWMLCHHLLLARFPPKGLSISASFPALLCSALGLWSTFILGLFLFPIIWTIASGDPIQSPVWNTILCRTPQIYTSPLRVRSSGNITIMAETLS